MTESIKNGERDIINGVEKIYFDGYWIKYYEPPAYSLKAKKKLIQSLTWRLFNHMEHGINIPGRLLEDVRTAYENETDLKKKACQGSNGCRRSFQSSRWNIYTPGRP